MSAMLHAGPRIESTGDTLRIEFRGMNRPVVFLAFMFCVLALEYLLFNLFEHIGTAKRVILLGVLLCVWIALMWDAAKRYTMLLSEKGLAIRQQAFGIHRTEFYPLAEMRNLRVRYNPVLKAPKQWELTFERNALEQTVPIAMTRPDAHNIKTAIYSRFPRLAPAQS